MKESRQSAGETLEKQRNIRETELKKGLIEEKNVIRIDGFCPWGRMGEDEGKDGR